MRDRENTVELGDSAEILVLLFVLPKSVIFSVRQNQVTLFPILSFLLSMCSLSIV